MGEIADDHFDQILFGRHDDDDGGVYLRSATPRCNRCRDTDVRWRQQGGRWVLFSLQPGVLHQCEISTQEFQTEPDEDEQLW